MLNSYLPVLIFTLVSLVLALAPIILGNLLSTKNPNPVKNAPYECGFPPFEDSRGKFDVRFYLIAILFIIFDLEIAFLFPWGTVFNKIGWLGFNAMLIFLLILTVGFIYEWRKGALEWE